MPRRVGGHAARVKHVPSDEEVLERLPDFLIDEDTIEHYRGILQKKLLINRCQNDGYWIYPHRPVCPQCWSDDVVPTEVSGAGSIFLLTFVHQGEPIPGVAFPIPLAGVELVEQQGLRYLGVIVDSAREDIRIGAAVELTWTERNGAPAPAFRVVSLPSPDS